MTAPLPPSGSRLDAVLPTYDFVERHARTIGGSPSGVYDAFIALTPRDIPVAAALLAVRSLPALLTGRPGLPTRRPEPLLDQFLDLGFVVLAEVPGEEMVLGLVGQMWRPGGRMANVENAEGFVAFSEPGFVKTAMTFRFTNRGDGSTLAATETRVLATDTTARRGFRRYWTLIRPFSGLIRRLWLRALARRAEPSATVDHLPGCAPLSAEADNSPVSTSPPRAASGPSSTCGGRRPPRPELRDRRSGRVAARRPPAAQSRRTSRRRPAPTAGRGAAPTA